MTETMNYNAFKNYIRDHIRGFLPEQFHDGTVKITTVYKSNDEALDSLFIEEPGNIASPNIYLEDYYVKYASGTSTDDIMEEIADFRMTYRSPEDYGLDPLLTDVRALEDFEKIKNRIIARVNNYEGSRKYLEDKPFKLIEDLAVTYHIYVECGQSVYTTAVTRDLMRLYETKVEELHSLALKNMLTLTPVWFRSLDTLVVEAAERKGIDAEDLDIRMTPDGLIDDDGTMVISNATRCYGAAIMLVPEVMDCMGRVLGKDLYIIPSSIHEVILRPAEQVKDIAELRKVVREINRSVVEKQERLSDNIYTYDFKKHVPVIVRKG